ncbi:MULTISPECIES: TolC family protein [unclassified Sphingobacterium]|uniref:TolC family protein n=1 Tax=Sphingobacterium TaxID=28453 RepID=UPI001611947F|nr:MULTISPECIES: TolC family protein [unclassified Sphingobacterium]MBB2950019.1 outer membrane protein TolC [Sphingobacterium sp. JUb56]QQD14059.1 TolC family protein [Sphingobacterium sp. UDSM-2020]
MKKIKIVGVLLAALFSVNFVHAQEILTLNQALKYALENKAEAKKSTLDLENAQYKIDEVRGGALPQISGAGTLTYNPMLQKVALPGEIIGKPGETVMVAMGQKWQSNASLQVNQQLFNQSLFTGLKAAKTTKEFYIINKSLSDEQLIEKVANAYYDVFQTQLQLETVDNNLNSTTKTRDVIAGLVQAGLGKKIDLDRTSVAVNNLKANRQILINALELKENALKFAIGMPMQQEVKLPNETFEINLSTADLAAAELASRTEVRLLEKQNQLLELNRNAMKAELYPKLSFSGNLGYLGMGPTFPIFTKNEGVKWSGFSGLGLNLSIPIFTGGTTKAKINQATIQLKQAQVDLEDTKLALSLSNENAKSQITNSLLTINSNRENVQLAKEVLDNTQNNYKNGLATLTDLLDAENAYADAQNNLSTSLLNYKVAEVQLIKAKGELNTLLNSK